jgi:hypothetical protein
MIDYILRLATHHLQYIIHQRCHAGIVTDDIILIENNFIKSKFILIYMNILSEKKYMKSRKYLFLGVVMIFLPSVAQAYVDPGTGAYLLQLLIAVFGAAVFYISKPAELLKLIRSFFCKKSKK